MPTHSNVTLSFTSDYNDENFANLFNSEKEWGILQGVSPQTYVLVAEHDEQVSSLGSELLSTLNLDHWPEIFLPQHGNSYSYTLNGGRSSSESFRIKFFCWYCETEARSYYYTMPLHWI